MSDCSYEDIASDYELSISIEEQSCLEDNEKTTIFTTRPEVKSSAIKTCEELQEALDIPYMECVVLLLHYHSRELILQEWMNDSTAIRQKIGFEPIKVAPESQSSQIDCPICLQSKLRTSFDSLDCNHLICCDCWTVIVNENVQAPERPFFCNCPIDGCNMILHDALNLKYLKPQNRLLYQSKIGAVYLQFEKQIKWCPANGCKYGAKVVTNTSTQVIPCLCGFTYCYTCGLEDHRPCKCASAAQLQNKLKTNVDKKVKTKECLLSKDEEYEDLACDCFEPESNFTKKYLETTQFGYYNETDELLDAQDLLDYRFYVPASDLYQGGNELSSEKVNEQQLLLYIHQKILNCDTALRKLNSYDSLNQTYRKSIEILKESLKRLKWLYACEYDLQDDSNDAQRHYYQQIQQLLSVKTSDLQRTLEQVQRLSGDEELVRRKNYEITTLEEQCRSV